MESEWGKFGIEMESQESNLNRFGMHVGIQESEEKCWLWQNSFFDKLENNLLKLSKNGAAFGKLFSGIHLVSFRIWFGNTCWTFFVLPVNFLAFLWSPFELLVWTIGPPSFLGLPLDCTWTSFGFPRDAVRTPFHFLCTHLELPLDSPFDFLVLSLASFWHFLGSFGFFSNSLSFCWFLLGFDWIPLGFPLVSFWIPFGLPLDCLWIPSEVP